MGHLLGMALNINGKRVENAIIERAAEYFARKGSGGRPNPNPDLARLNALEKAKERIIERELIEQEAQRRGPAVDATAVEAAYLELVKGKGGEEAFLKSNGLSNRDVKRVKLDLELRLRVDGMVREVLDAAPNPTEAEIKEYYASGCESGRYIEQESVKAAHIVKHINEKQTRVAARAGIEAAKERLDTGADFAAVAAECSDCPEKGGGLGWFSKGAMVEAFENEVFALAPGEISGIFETPFGFHLAHLEDRKPARRSELEDVREDIDRTLIEKSRNTEFEKFMRGLKERAEIAEV